jgi:hypothetical protein
MPMICSSENRFRFIPSRPFVRAGLYSQMEEKQGVTSLKGRD